MKKWLIIPLSQYKSSSTWPTASTLLTVVSVAALLSGCTANTSGKSIFDPYEKRNRKVHALNKKVDRNLLSPASQGYGSVIPQPVRRGVSNFSTNLDQPANMANHLLQGNMEFAMQNFWRFLVNTTVGIGGIFDPASKIGLTDKRTGFGATMGIWGVPEGAYVELPLMGPSTERDTIGTVVDFTVNPLQGLALKPNGYVVTSAKVLSKVGDRYEYSGIVDSILYESADSYAQARLLYLQSRRGEVGDTAAAEAEADEVYDSYEDFYDN